MKSWISNKPLTPEKEDSSEWNSTTDTISLKVRSDLLKLSATDHQRTEGIKLTKRMFLRNIAKIYDPIRSDYQLRSPFTPRLECKNSEEWVSTGMMSYR